MFTFPGVSRGEHETCILMFRGGHRRALKPSVVGQAEKLPATWPATFRPKTHCPNWFCDAKSELTATPRTHRDFAKSFMSCNGGGRAVVVAILSEH